MALSGDKPQLKPWIGGDDGEGLWVEKRMRVSLGRTGIQGWAPKDRCHGRSLPAARRASLVSLGKLDVASGDSLVSSRGEMAEGSVQGHLLRSLSLLRGHMGTLGGSPSLCQVSTGGWGRKETSQNTQTGAAFPTTGVRSPEMRARCRGRV